MRKRIFVIGGTGRVGSRVLSLLEERTEFEVLAPKHGGPGGFDTEDSSTYDALIGSIAVVNCGPAPTDGSMKAMKFCTNNDILWIESTADMTSINKLLNTSADLNVICGVGLFPGLSNLLIKHSSHAFAELGSFELAVKVSAFSGAGRDMCRLMVQLALEKPRSLEDSQLRELSAGASKNVNYLNGSYLGVYVSLPELATMRRYAHVRAGNALISIQPNILGVIFLYVRRLIAGKPWLHQLCAKLMYTYLVFLRVYLLRRRKARVEIRSQWRSENGMTNEVAIVTPDGIYATAAAVVATTQLLVRHEVQRVPMTTSVDQILTLDTLIQEMNGLAPNLELQVIPPSNSNVT